jgi:N6-adenosine-specific RNA methylase IME4
MSTALVPVRTPGEWAEVVRADLARSVEGFVAAGAHLAEAKEQMPHGEWLPWIEQELPIGVREVQRLIEVARHPVISNATHGSHLPASGRTLYELSRLEPPALEAAIAEGRVTPELERKQARALVAEYKATAPRLDVIDAEVVPSVPDVATGLVSTITADPPWRYGNTSTRGAAEDHYPTMSIEELCDLDIARERSAEESHLYLWATAGHLPEAFKVMEAWGFTYKTYLVWVKPQMGMGNYFRVSTELVLFGVKGGLRTNHRGLVNHFTAKRSRHSAKPRAFRDLVKQASPGPYLEMFARCRKDEMLTGCECARCEDGWEVWGNQA